MNSRGLPTTRGQTVGEGRAFELGGAVVLGGAASVLPTSGAKQRFDLGPAGEEVWVRVSRSGE
jgi:hypothetical protein